jgi:hypothetical protein
MWGRVSNVSECGHVGNVPPRIKTAGVGNPCRPRPHLGRWRPAVDLAKFPSMRARPDAIHGEAVFANTQIRERHLWRRIRASRPFARFPVPTSGASMLLGRCRPKPGDPSTSSDKRNPCATEPRPSRNPIPWNRSKSERSYKTTIVAFRLIIPGEPRKGLSGEPIAKRSWRRATLFRIANRCALNSVFV